jgi:hypothetical protein
MEMITGSTRAGAEWPLADQQTLGTHMQGHKMTSSGLCLSAFHLSRAGSLNSSDSSRFICTALGSHCFPVAEILLFLRDVPFYLLGHPQRAQNKALHILFGQ